jgi:DNA-binding MarR family transcriptional regulator
VDDGPRWARSLQTVKPYVQGLIDVGLVERVFPPNAGRGRNMLALTELGSNAISKAA